VKSERSSRLDHDGAERLAIAALGFLSSDLDRLGRFLSEAGIGPETLRAAAEEPGFLAGVLEYLMRDEDLLIAFAEETRTRPTMVAAARYVLDPEVSDD
jgi:Protein of unknown function (DUF3572)